MDGASAGASCFSRRFPIACGRGNTTEGIAGIQPRELERRRERVRRAWAYRRVDHLPLGFILEDTGGYSLRELCQDGGRQLELNIRSIDRLLRLLPDDYLPAARLWPGYMTIATMFGLSVHWGEDPRQPPGVNEHPIRDLSQVHGLSAPDPRGAGLMPFVLSWTREFARALPPEVYLAGPDLGGPLNTAKDLFETNLLFTAPYDDAPAFRKFLRLAAEVQASCYREVIAAAGGLERLTCIDFDPLWAPEGRKGFVSDDVCAGLSSEHFAEFSRPYNNRIFREWPGGRLHNCGPHPAVGEYLGHDPGINGLNCSFRYTRGELERLREAFRGRGIVELMFDNGETAVQILQGFEEAASALVPDVVAIPLVWFNQDWSDGDIRALFEDLRAVAARAAGHMNWVGEL
jgi:uroporphyrinogen-III decarboxylase